MSILSVLFLSVGLAMDAFAVSVGCGIKSSSKSFVYPFKIALSFGFFQALMPVAGFLFGRSFANLISAYDHWIAFLLLAAIGIKMIAESFEKSAACDSRPEISFGSLMALSVATSIDALAAGVSLALLNISIFFPAFIIGIVTFSLSFLGVRIGDRAGRKLKKYAEIAGGIILLSIGVKILLEHIL